MLLAAPLTFKPTQLHPLEAKQAAASGTLAQSAVVSSPRPVAVKKPPAHTASWRPSVQQQSMALQSHASLNAPVRPQPAQLPHAAVADAEPGVGSAASAVELQPRGYEALLDDLSEHQLLIHKGKLVQDTPEVQVSYGWHLGITVGCLRQPMQGVSAFYISFVTYGI